MNSPSDNSDAVQKILRLKRHEQPPPGYFNQFSGRVIARIERGEACTSWWERFGFDMRPALAAATGVFACALVIYGVATADDAPPVNMGVLNSFAASPSPSTTANDFIASADMAGANSTNPVISY